MSLRTRNHSLSPRVLATAMAVVLAMPAAWGAARNTSQLRVTDAARLRTDREDAQTDRFIVRFRDAGRMAASTRMRALQRALDSSGLATNKRAGIALQRVRTLATGAEVVRLSRPLDRVDAAALMRSIAADPSVERVERDARLRHTGVVASKRAAPQLVPDDELYAQYQWHLHDPTGGVDAPAAWDESTGAGVVVAVIDTGIVDHEDIAGNVLEGYDFITDAFISRRETDERVAGAHDRGDWNDDPAQCRVSPSSFHGTHVAGTVAESTNNGIGMAGVAHGAKVLPVRALGRCGGYLSDIADAVVWASGGSVAGVPDNQNPAEVINMSLGGAGACAAGSAMQIAIDRAIANGSTVVVAAGNDNGDAADFTPASCAGVVTVGATRIGGGRAGYSNYGARIDLSAPGGGGSIDGNPNGYVWQNINNSATAPENGTQTYGGMSGTSMAAPHVAGVAALVQAVAESPLTPQQMRALLMQTARSFPVAIPASTPMGTGIVDARAAVAATEPPCEGDDCEPPIEAIVLSNRVPVQASGEAAGELLYSIEVPAGTRSMSIISYSGTGDLSLLASLGSVPLAEDADWRSSRPGNNETIRVTAPRPGVYFIKVVGVTKFAGARLEVRYD